MQNKFTRRYKLTAADCDAQFELPLAALVQNIIEVATDHANVLGVGYDRLVKDGNAWVLIRLSVELDRMPRVGDDYIITTWVEDFNRHFSRRDFEISIASGDTSEVTGHVVSMWTVIDSTTRKSAPLDSLGNLEKVKNPHGYIPAKAPRVKPRDFMDAEKRYDYRVAVSDTDTNRHLTSMRYIQLMINLWALDHYDHNVISRFEIAFSNEARYDDTVTLSRLDLDTGTHAACLMSRGDETLAMSTIAFRKRQEGI